jgi:hypothetical protein
MFLVKYSLAKRKCEMVHCCGATTSSFVDKVWGEVFAHFHVVAIEHHNIMRNWLFGLPGRILCEQSPWCQRQWCACFSLCTSLASLFSVLVSLDFPCTTYAFFPKRLFNHCQGLRCSSSEICTTFYAFPLLDSSRNHIWPHTWPQIKGHEKSAHPLSCVKFWTLASKIC